MSCKNVIIFEGSISSWGVIQGLKKRDVDIYVISANKSSIGASSKYVKKHFDIRTDESCYVRKIVDIIDQVGGKPTLMIAGDDHALESLSKNHDLLVTRSIPTFPPWETLSKIVDKNNLAMAAKQIGVKAIPTVCIKNSKEFEKWLKESGVDFKSGYFLKCQDSITFKNKYGTKGIVCQSKEKLQTHIINMMVFKGNCLYKNI